ncbi:Mog1/PsbP, alpha/beta/alpha sandwich [Cynara cardunculus var. scolymus]|uniref:Mog1/PsbP, alpha/beta/alpha sandwich n=1 Tax=Cynara cardunculus var. scolymus TaxID=59895 RepID=A0A118JZ88_CYNCS|nr:Mog1/PsbP, alpha/beta/alpha sandwich [Cynara cardunculus var. scolymus]
MLSLQQLPCIHQTLLLNASTQLGVYANGRFQRGVPFLVRAEQISAPSTSLQVAAENAKGFLPVTDKTDGYSFIYPFGWQEIVIEGQDKVFKDVIEPLENVSVNVFPTNKENIRDLGSPQEVAEALIKKVLAPPSQKTKLLNATEHDVDGKAYYTFEFVAQAPNFTRHALSTITIGNGKFYTLTTGANERRWGKMKDKLSTVVGSFKIFNV